MTTLKFKCTLLSEIIINQKAATEGPNKTLDFIPGSNFLGIAAANYKEFGEDAMEIFHSGKVRFGDAHPVTEDTAIRSLRIPASFYYPKLNKPSDVTYVFHAITDFEALKPKQLKQCRTGFYEFREGIANEVKTEKSFAIKSAHNKDERRSKDEQMYGYQSLRKGLVLCFEVEIENDELVERISNALTGTKRVGRSRTAQYGLVKIEKWNYTDVLSRESKNDTVTVYADGRLIILDEFGLPTFQPSADDLGVKGGKIIWEKSQIRTFQYTPWNYHRQCHDTDRCGIEKGSVFVIKSSNSPNNSQYIGSYKNEGFGKVIFNPAFLDADDNELSIYKIAKEDTESNLNEPIKESPEKIRSDINALKQSSNSELLQYLGEQKEQEYINQDVYKKVNDWVKKHQNKFRGDTFASQWGTIRSIAMQYKTKEDLERELISKTKSKNEKDLQDGYLTHGVAAEKWSERGRLVEFKKFVKQLNENNVQIAIINLAAEMAKKCKEGERK